MVCVVAADADCSALVLLEGLAGDCPEAEAVKNVTSVNGTAALMSARSFDTLSLLLAKRSGMNELPGLRLTGPRNFPWLGEPSPVRNAGVWARFDQQSVTERARPASLVSLYLLFISLAVWARAITVSSKLTRCLDAISFVASA